MAKSASREAVTLRAFNAPFESVVFELCKRSDVSLVIEPGLSHEKVTVDLDGVPFEVALRAISRQVGTEFVEIEGVYYVGEPEKSDRPVLVRRVRRLSGDELRLLLDVVSSSDGTSTVHDDGLIVVRDSPQVFTRLERMLDELEEIESVTWVVQLYFTRSVVADLHALGVEFVPAAEVGASLANIAFGDNGPVAIPLTDAAIVEASIAARLTAEAERQRGKQMLAPSIITGDGLPATMFEGRTITVRTQATNVERGTVTDAGFESIDVGTTIELTVREVGPDRGRLELSVDVASLDGLIDGLPQITQTRFDTTAELNSGHIYLLGRIDGREEEKSLSTFLRFGRSDSDSDRSIELWARVHRVGGYTDVSRNEFGSSRDGTKEAGTVVPSVDGVSVKSSGSKSRSRGLSSELGNALGVADKVVPDKTSIRSEAVGDANSKEGGNDNHPDDRRQDESRIAKIKRLGRSIGSKVGLHAVPDDEDKKRVIKPGIGVDSDSERVNRPASGSGKSEKRTGRGSTRSEAISRKTGVGGSGSHSQAPAPSINIVPSSRPVVQPKRNPSRSIRRPTGATLKRVVPKIDFDELTILNSEKSDPADAPER